MPILTVLGVPGNTFYTLSPLFQTTAAEAVRRYTDFVLTFLFAPTVSLNRSFRDAEADLGNVSRPEEFVPYNQSISARLSTIRWYVDIASQELLQQLSASLYSLPLYGEYSYDSQLLTPLLSTSRVSCSWCINPTNREPLIQILVAKLMDSIQTKITESIDKIKTSADLLGLVYVNASIAVNITVDCPEYEVTTEVTTESTTEYTTEGTTEYTTEDTTEDTTEGTTVAITTEAPLICLNESIIADWGSFGNMSQDLLNNITQYLSDIESSVNNVVNEATDLVGEFLRHVGPKCESELAKLYDEYVDIYTKLQTTLSTAETHYSAFKTEFATFDTHYTQMNTTLPMILTQARFDYHKTFINTQTVTLDNLLSSRTNALYRIRNHINTINYWMISQVDLGYFLNTSRVWHHFGVNESSEYTPGDAQCTGSSCMVEPALEATWWTSRVSSLNAEMTTAQNALSTVIWQAESYLTSFTDGNAIDDAFYK